MSSAVATKVHDYFTTFPRREYPKGQILVFADENPDHIFYLLQGRVRKYDVSYRGDEVIITVFQPPSFFPMSWALNHTPNHYFYKTETPVIMHAVPSEAALAFLKDNPDVALDLLSRLYKGLEGLYGRMVHLMSGSAHSRLIYELLIECRRFGKKETKGSCSLQTNEVDLAARSGLSRETVSREMQKLKRKGWIKNNRGTIVVTDVAQLEEALGSGV